MKREVFGLIHFCLGILFLVFTLWYISAPYERIEYSTFFIPLVILGGYSVLNFFLSYKHLKTAPKKLGKRIMYGSFFAILIPAWLIIYFIVSLTASIVWFPVGGIVFTILFFFVMKKENKAFAIFMSLITILLICNAVVAGFEEDYCVQKGEDAAKGKPDMVIATKQDAEDLKGFDVKEGSQIGAAFRVHMLCHTTFDFNKAFKEKYLLQK